MRGKKSRLETLNEKLRPYGLQCYTWSPGDGVTRYRFSHDLDSCFSSCSEFCTVLGAGQAELVAKAYLRGHEIGQARGYFTGKEEAEKED